MKAEPVQDSRVWRVGYAPDPWAWTDWRYASKGRFDGRWDDPEGLFRTVYAGASLLACLVEVLAVFRSADLPEMEEIDDDPAYPTIAAGHVDESWLRPRRSAEALLTGRFCAVTSSAILAHLHLLFESHAKKLGLADFDAAALKDTRSRPLTQAVSKYLWEQHDVDRRPVFDGVSFASRHGDDRALWALYERPGGATSVSPCLRECSVNTMTASTPEINEAFTLLRLQWA